MAGPLSPCGADASSCQTGDQCCGGFCSATAGGTGVCSSTPSGTCSGPEEKCATVGDCCAPTARRTNGFCAVPHP